MFHKVIVLNILSMCTGQPGCDQDSLRSLNVNFKECQKQHKDTFKKQLESDPDSLEVATCRLVTDLVTTCANLWSSCHSREWVVRIKDRQLQSIITKNQDKGVLLDSCPVVKEFKDFHSPRAMKPKCSKEETETKRAEFEMCSHNTTSTIYKEVNKSKDTGSLFKNICDSLYWLSSECFGNLAVCMFQKDFDSLKSLHMEGVLHHVSQFLGDGLNISSLFDCTSATKKISNILSDQSDKKTLESESSNEEEYHQLTAMSLNISAKVLQSDITSSTSLANRDFSTFHIVIIFLLCYCSNPTM